MNRLLLIVLSPMLFLFIATCVPAQELGRDPESLESTERTIARLIGELGADEFVRREEAQQRLLDIGLQAFDALAEAQDNADIEIAERARYILRSLRFAWVEEEEDEAVRDAVRDYDTSSISERRSRIERLGLFPSTVSSGALARIVRFEREPLLSKQAALAVMRQKVQPDQREALAAQLLASVGSSVRDGAKWLRLYARTLRDPQATIDEWANVVMQQRRLLGETSDTSARDVVREVMRWRAEQLMDLDAVAARPALLELLDLVDDNPTALLAAADWYASVGAWDMVETMHERFAPTFQDSVLLQYRFAEALSRQEKEDAAEAAAAAALQLHPQRYEEHRLAADMLQERGLHAWSEQEYLSLIKSHEPTELISVRSRLMLAELYHDQYRELEAAQVLQAMFDAMQDNPVIGEHLANLRSLESTRARMLLFYANHYGAQGDTAKQKESLAKGLELEVTEIDLLIAQHQFSVKHPKDQAWRESVMKAVNETLSDYRDGIRTWREQLNDRSNPPRRAQVEYTLATFHNQLAWLIANTEGDFDEAVAASQESLRLRPNYPGHLDTLGRCYYARGDLEQAVKHQRRACELDPGSLSMKRQLQLFESALAEANAKR